MSWKLEIYRASFVAFGTLEIICNLHYLCSSNGMAAAAKQHKELPSGVSDEQLMVKVIFMLISGILFFLSGISSYLVHYVNTTLFLWVLILFSLYAAGEALYYRYWKTVGFFTVSLFLLAGFWIG